MKSLSNLPIRPKPNKKSDVGSTQQEHSAQKSGVDSFLSAVESTARVTGDLVPGPLGDVLSGVSASAAVSSGEPSRIPGAVVGILSASEALTKEFLAKTTLLGPLGGCLQVGLGLTK